MTQQERYESAKQMYGALGVDTDAAIAKLKEIPVSLHCWQGDDVIGLTMTAPLPRNSNHGRLSRKSKDS